MDNHNTSARKVQEVEIIDIPSHHTVYATKQGKYAEVSHLERKPIATIRKLDKDRYQVIKTGEVKFFNHNRSGEKQIAHMRKSMMRLRGIIRANFGENPKHERHITFSYRSNMQDAEKLMRDFQRWYERLKYHHKSHKYDYIAIAEPQERGAWHLHLLLKSDKPLWLDYNQLGDWWRAVTGEDCGNPQHEEIPDGDVGAYFVAYFTTVVDEDIELSGDKEAIKKAAKAAQKGSRLHFYPPYFKFYRCSRGIRRPKPEEMAKHVIESEFSELLNAKRYEVADDMGNVIQRVQKMTIKKE